MNGKQSGLAILFSICLLTLVTLPSARQQSGSSYDPWLDYNDDGIIDANDLYPLGQAYGGAGDPTKDVNVVNWPTETFAKNLLLRPTSSIYPSYHLLIDEDMPYANPNVEGNLWGRDYDRAYVNLDNTHLAVIYKQNFVYENIPTKSYQLLGMPTVSLTFNLSSNPPSPREFSIQVYARLGVVSSTNTWTQLVDLGMWGEDHSAPLTNYQSAVWFAAEVLDPITINSNERIALQIEVDGAANGDMWLTFTLWFGMNTDEFLVSIPIVENP